MKNYLVTSLHKFENWDFSKEDPYDGYKSMEVIHEKSFKKNLKGDFEYILFEGHSKGPTQMFKKQFDFLKNLWNNEPCNILYCGPDTVCVKELDIFNYGFLNMMMFNYTEPTQYLDIEHYLNADVIYYPHEMDSNLWELGEELWEKSNYKWNCDQYILNKMVWKQGLNIEDVLYPELNFMGHNLPNIQQAEMFNRISIKDARIVHITGTRNLKFARDMMNTLLTKGELT